MNNNIVWKSFKVGDIFTPERGRDMSVAQKNLDKSKDKTDEYSIAIVTESTLNNGIGFYLKPTANIYTNKIRYKGLTYGGQFGNVNYHNYPYYIVGNLNYMTFNSDKLYNLCTDYVGQYIAKVLSKVFKKSGLFNYVYKLKDSDFSREYILLPCIECSKEESIWEDKYTLAVEYIESLMERAKERREENTIKKYEAERKKYEAERKKYEAEYLIEKNNVVWKSFKVENLFTPERGRDMSVAQKNLNKSNVKTDEYSIAIVTESTLNNGIGFYLKPTENIYTNKIRYKGLTFGGQFGNVNYHNYPYYIIGNVNYMIFNNDKLYNLCTDYVGQYIAKVLNKVFKKSGLFNYVYKLKDSDFNREYIILPCIETTKENSIWEDKYTLAINYISYIYLSGRIKNCQRLIDNYTYRY